MNVSSAVLCSFVNLGLNPCPISDGAEILQPEARIISGLEQSSLKIDHWEKYHMDRKYWPWSRVQVMDLVLQRLLAFQ